MKNLVIVFLTILFSNIAYATYVNGEVEYKQDSESLTNLVGPDEKKDKECYNNGYGDSDCRITHGIDFGGGITAGCSVICVPGTYACCALRCYCKIYEE